MVPIFHPMQTMQPHICTHSSAQVPLPQVRPGPPAMKCKMILKQYDSPPQEFLQLKCNFSMCLCAPYSCKRSKVKRPAPFARLLLNFNFIEALHRLTTPRSSAHWPGYMRFSTRHLSPANFLTRTRDSGTRNPKLGRDGRSGEEERK